jgi:hypothetical protein
MIAVVKILNNGHRFVHITYWSKILYLKAI